MKTPGFTAEASTGLTTKGFAATLGPAGSTGIVPQFCFRQPGSSFVSCVTCVDLDGDGVADDCWVVRKAVGIPYF